MNNICLHIYFNWAGDINIEICRIKRIQVYNVRCIIVMTTWLCCLLQSTFAAMLLSARIIFRTTAEFPDLKYNSIKTEISQIPLRALRNNANSTLKQGRQLFNIKWTRNSQEIICIFKYNFILNNVSLYPNWFNYQIQLNFMFNIFFFLLLCISHVRKLAR